MIAVNHYLRRNSLWLLFARLTAQGLAILFIAVVARRVDINDFGRFAFISALVLIGNTFTNFGTDTLLIRETSYAGRVTHLASRAFCLQLVLSVLFCLALFFYYDPPLSLYSLSLFPLTLFSVGTALLRALGRMDLFWSLSLTNGLFQLTAAIFSNDLWTLINFLLIGQLILAALAVWVCSTFLPDFKLLPLKDIRPIISLTLPFAVLTILLVITQRLGILSVSALLDDTATGLFSSVIRIVDGLKFGHYAILGALLPALSRGTSEVWNKFRLGFFILMITSLLMALVVSLIASPFINILYGKNFMSAIRLLSLLVWSLLPYTISSFISYALIARGLEYTLVKATVISLIIYISLYLWLINSSGLTGAVWAALIGECLQAGVFALFYFAGDGSIHSSTADRTNDIP